MELITFAPEDFKEHLSVLDNKAKFKSARQKCDLGFTTTLQHYVITGNDGVGKGDAVQEIYQRMADIAGLTNCVTEDAATMFDANTGFGEALSNACSNNNQYGGGLDR